MRKAIRNSRYLALRRTTRQQTASQSTTSATLARPSRTAPTPIEPTTTISAHLQHPTWSVRSLLPPEGITSDSTIPPQTLHHLLRLSALPSPQSPTEESQLLATLSAQLHFARAVQAVDTTDIQPLRAIRDETSVGLREQTLGLAELRDALAEEDLVGHARRPRRRRALMSPATRSDTKEGEGAGASEIQDTSKPGCDEIRTGKRTPNDEESWDVLGGASETAAGRRYFVVRSSGTGSQANGTVSGES
ncbi:hypothetical protein GGR50DRAFT_372301 [Xylaria sp. CBS 124048]|nr:hypothetical protein GGR50DRAFT_372301 [Xylaria sp. CBS 124048]